MNLISLLAVFVGGGLGSLCRYGISKVFVATGSVSKFPIGTLISNILACVVMALVIYFVGRHRGISDNWNVFWLIGFCGGFSTFSTFSYENWLLYRQASYGMFALNILVSVGLCLVIFIIAARSVSVSGG